MLIHGSNYSDWLLKGLRKKVSIKKLVGIFKANVSPYNLKFTMDKENSFNCLQLLSFMQTQKVQFVELLDLVIVEFAVVDFIKFMGKNEKYTHQRNKVIKFLDDFLKLEPLRIQVNDVTFQCSWLQLQIHGSLNFVYRPTLYL